jgi:WD40 repeat protein
LPTALAIDRTSDVIAVGLESGQVQLGPVAAAAEARDSLAYFGHRGPVTSVAVNGARGIAASGGNDGIVRVWDVASGAPTGTVAQPIDAPIALVALSADGLRVAGAAGSTVRVANVADGTVTLELQAESAVTALAFSRDSARIGIGDASGIVQLAVLADPGERATASVGAGVESLVFGLDGRRLFAADSSGAITTIVPATGAIEASVRRWSQPIRWLEVSPDGGALLVATDSWLHALAAVADLAPVNSKLVAWPASSTAFAAISATAVGFAGVADGAVVSGTIDLTAAPDELDSDAAALVARDWRVALGLQLNDNGDSVPLDP